ncbi:MAG: HNH endonuclease [Promethearchaeota archaeon]
MSKRRERLQLGMSLSTARNILIKNILFAQMKELNKDNCWRCSKKIERVEDLSIEHKVHWLDSKNPKDLYFDLSNITFSHFKCNSKFSRQPAQKIFPKDIKDILILKNKGLSLKQIAVIYNVSKRVLSRWINKYSRE